MLVEKWFKYIPGRFLCIPQVLLTMVLRGSAGGGGGGSRWFMVLVVSMLVVEVVGVGRGDRGGNPASAAQHKRRRCPTEFPVRCAAVVTPFLLSSFSRPSPLYCLVYLSMSVAGRSHSWSGTLFRSGQAWKRKGIFRGSSASLEPCEFLFIFFVSSLLRKGCCIKQ